MNAVRLYQKHSKAELLALMSAIEADPANAATGLYRFTPAARSKLEAITRAITWHLADDRAKAGDPVIADGYSGRQSNRRR